MALMLVLLLLSLTVGLCYAAMRGRFTAAVIQRNADRTASARQAAVAGMMIAIKKMHRDDWGGVGTSLSGSLGDYESYSAAFTAGDAELSDDDPDQPYRVTLLSTGYAVDPQHPASVATYQVRAVLRLIPRRLAAQPSDWETMQGYVVYQTRREDVEIDIPCRFTGKVRLQKKLKLAPHYPNDDDARERYMSDLNQMRLAGWPDYRTFDGPVHLPFGDQEGKYFSLLTSELGVTAVDAPAQEAGGDWVKPTGPSGYRIYQGGPLYTVQPVSYYLSNTSLEPDPQINPLGLFYRDGSVSIYDNVTVQGTLLCKDEVRVRGANVVFQPVDLPPLAGEDAPVRLATIGSNKLKIYDDAAAQITGLAAVFDEFRIDEGSDQTEFNLSGRLIARKIEVDEREEWKNCNWDLAYFLFQYSNPDDPMEYFPEFMAGYGYDPAPRLVIAPEETEARYHWSNGYDPIFVPHRDDGGLRWDLLSWSEEQ